MLKVLPPPEGGSTLRYTLKYNELGAKVKWSAPSRAETIRPQTTPAVPRGDRYFQKQKMTAAMRQRKAAKWFQWMGSPLKTKVTMRVKTVREMTS